jgi:hypothetical protein
MPGVCCLCTRKTELGTWHAAKNWWLLPSRPQLNSGGCRYRLLRYSVHNFDCVIGGGQIAYTVPCVTVECAALGTSIQRRSITSCSIFKRWVRLIGAVYRSGYDVYITSFAVCVVLPMV